MWLKTQMHVDPSAPTVTREDFLNYMHVPKVDLDKFDGNPLEYLTFIAVFDEMVDRRVTDGQVKRLLQYTSGSAKSAIKNFALLGGEAGYDQARDILRNRYGNSHIVSQRLIAELKNGKRVVKAHDLQQLADELSMALTALEQLGKHGELNTQQSMMEILQICQPHTRNRWCNKALESKCLNDEYPNFEDFTEFVQREAEACDPVYGLFSTKQREDVNGANFHTVAYASGASFTKPCALLKLDFLTSAHNKCIRQSESPALVRRKCFVEPAPGPVISFGPRCKPARAADSSARPCVVCGQPHRLFQCEMYKSMQYKSMRHKLCYKCLLAGHVSNACYKQSMCTVPDCSRKHSELLHFVEDDNVLHDCVVQANDSIQVCNTVTMGEGANVYLPIVPVIVNGSSRSVYALLDTGSTNTFITKQLAQQFHLQGNAVQYNMSTLSQNCEVKSTTVSFCLKSVHDDVKLDVRTALAVNSIPVRYPSNVIDVEQYPYLRDLDVARLGSDVRVDILIGMDNADALMPLEVRCSDKQKRMPYAYSIRVVTKWTSG